jgi:hypothetical protein
MFIVDIHPFTGYMPNKEVKITSYKFETREKAIEFLTHYNANYVLKVALLAENQEKEPA